MLGAVMRFAEQAALLRKICHLTHQLSLGLACRLSHDLICTCALSRRCVCELCWARLRSARVLFERESKLPSAQGHAIEEPAYASAEQQLRMQIIPRSSHTAMQCNQLHTAAKEHACTSMDAIFACC